MHLETKPILIGLVSKWGNDNRTFINLTDKIWTDLSVKQESFGRHGAHSCFKWHMSSNGTTTARFIFLLILKLKNGLKYQTLYSFQLSTGSKLFRKAKLRRWWTKIEQKTKNCPKKGCFLRTIASLTYFFGNFDPRYEVPHIKT